MALTSTAQHVGKRVRDRLRDRGLTQTDLAGALSLTQSVVSTRLRGVVAFNVDELAIVASVLGCSVSDLLADDAPSREPGATS